MTADIYAPPRQVRGLEECSFYHTMDIPGFGRVDGQWDLRGRESIYLGGVDLAGRRVLEIGTASGFLCFYMERQGAEVVAFDLDDTREGDLVPYTGRHDPSAVANGRAYHGRVNNGYWLCHQALQSKARVVYGTVYQLPTQIGPVDLTTVCSVLLHLRDPFLALQNAARLTTGTIVVTEPIGKGAGTLRRLARRYLRPPEARFLPDYKTGTPEVGWWALNPEIVRRFIGVLGFEDSEVTYHDQNLAVEHRQVANFTVVGHRTRPLPEP